MPKSPSASSTGHPTTLLSRVSLRLMSLRVPWPTVWMAVFLHMRCPPCKSTACFPSSCLRLRQGPRLVDKMWRALEEECRSLNETNIPLAVYASFRRKVRSSFKSSRSQTLSTSAFHPAEHTSRPGSDQVCLLYLHSFIFHSFPCIF